MARSMRESGWAALGLALGTLAVGAAAAPPPDAYLDDGRTARSVMLRAPRATLAQCLQALTTASGVTLASVSPLQDDYLVGCVPKRPLRETMGALAELFDGRWTATETPAGLAYRLEPEPAAAGSQRLTRVEKLMQVQKSLDAEAATVLQEARSAKGIADSRIRMQVLALLLWSMLTPDQRKTVLAGQTLTAPVPSGHASIVAKVLNDAIARDAKRADGPMLVTFDLDDRADEARPILRARVTACSDDAIVGAVGAVDPQSFRAAGRVGAPGGNAAPPNPPANPAAKKEAELETPLPMELGMGGRLDGTRDEQAVKLGELCGLPVLSRHRAKGGSGETILVGGRKPSEIMEKFAASCDAKLKVTTRGFYLLRSPTEWLDSLSNPAGESIRDYLKTRPAEGKPVPLGQLIKLGAMNPLQLSVLERCNQVGVEATFLRAAFAVVRFQGSLTPEQRTGLHSEKGVSASELTHAQLHVLLDERARRGDYDIYTQLQQRKGLHLRFVEQLTGKAPQVLLQAVRDGKVLTSNELELAIVEPEEPVTAVR